MPELDHRQFLKRLRRHQETPLSATSERLLFGHYETLRLWNRRLALIGPGTLDQIFERHYGESLAAAALIRPADRVVVDIGSGAGFPGLILSAVFPERSFWLVESRMRKWSFLRAAVRQGKAAIKDEAATEQADAVWSCNCVNARIDGLLPDDFPDRIDVVTSRAVRVTPQLLAPFVTRSAHVRFLLWQGEQKHQLPPGAVITNERPLPGGIHRTIIEVECPRPGGSAPAAQEERDPE